MFFDEHLADLMDRHRFSIVEMRTLSSGGAPWTRGADGELAFEAERRWREVALLVRRELSCERCGAAFDYTFVVVEQGHNHRGGRMATYTALEHALERQLRRRVHCPHCDAVQRRARQTLTRRARRHNLVGGAALGGSILGAVALILGGYALAGGWGLVLGGGLSAWLVLALTRWMLVQLLEG